MKKISLYTIFIGFIFTLTACNTTKTVAIEDGWDLLGERKVNFIRDRDELQVMNQTKYSAIKFQVVHKDVTLNDVNIVYPNGDKLSPSLNDVIPAGGYSKEIQIDPEGKIIRSIQFKYRSTGNVLKGRASVLVFGKRATAGYGNYR